MQKIPLYRWAPVLTVLAMGCAATAPSQPTHETDAGKVTSQGPEAGVRVSESRMEGAGPEAPNAALDLQGLRGGAGGGYGQPAPPHGGPHPYPKPPKPGTIPMPPAECDVCNVYADGYLSLGGQKVRVTVSTEAQTVVLAPQRQPGRRYQPNSELDVTFTMTGVQCNDTEAWITGQLVDKRGKVQTITIYLNETTQQIIAKGQNNCFVFKGKMNGVQIGELCHEEPPPPDDEEPTPPPDDEEPPPPEEDCLCWVTTGGQFELGTTRYTFTISRQNVTINNLSTPGVDYRFDLENDSVDCDDVERTITLPGGAGTIAVRDNGEGQAAPPDELSIAITGSNPLSTGGFIIPLSRGNIQFHRECTEASAL